MNWIIRISLSCVADGPLLKKRAMKLYFSRNYNPRLAVAVARYLNSPLEFEFASPFSPGEREKFIKLNPNLSVPILVEGEATLWEADAIACRLSQLVSRVDAWHARLMEISAWKDPFDGLDAPELPPVVADAR